MREKVDPFQFIVWMTIIVGGCSRTHDLDALGRPCDEQHSCGPDTVCDLLNHICVWADKSDAHMSDVGWKRDMRTPVDVQRIDRSIQDLMTFDISQNDLQQKPLDGSEKPPDKGLVDRGPPDLSPPPSDEGVLDTSPLHLDLSPICSASGIPRECDPIDASGCSVGKCYLVKDKGPSCVCPEGAIPLGEDCNTTTECEPGYVCVGSMPPGVCRKLCYQGSGGPCGSGEVCISIVNQPQFGFCI